MSEGSTRRPIRDLLIADVPQRPVFHSCLRPDPGQKHNLAKLIALKTRWPALNAVMRIGGWYHSHRGANHTSHTPVWSAVAASSDSRQAFVLACIELFIKPPHPKIGPLFSGIDLDREYPSTSTDQQNYPLLLHELRSQLDTVGQAQGRHLT